MAAFLLASRGMLEDGAEGRRSSDHYRVLGVRADAPAKALELAYWRWCERRRRAEVGGEQFGRIELAYRILSDPVSRARHDRRIGRALHPAWEAERRAASGRLLTSGLRLMARGRNRAALQRLQRAVELSPGDPCCRSYLALLLARTGSRLHEAARHGEFAVARRPRDAACLLNLAAVYDRAGLRGRALRLRARAWVQLVRGLLRPGAGARRAAAAAVGSRAGAGGPRGREGKL